MNRGGLYVQEYYYQRGREEVHRRTNDNTNSRIMFFSVLEGVALVACSVVQVHPPHPHRPARSTPHASDRRVWWLRALRCEPLPSNTHAPSPNEGEGVENSEQQVERHTSAERGPSLARSLAWLSVWCRGDTPSWVLPHPP